MSIRLQMLLALVIAALSVVAPVAGQDEKEEEYVPPKWGSLSIEHDGAMHGMRVTEVPADGRIDVGIDQIAMAYTQLGQGEKRKHQWLLVEYTKDSVFVHVPQGIIERGEGVTYYHGGGLYTPKASGQTPGGDILLLANDARIQGATAKLKRDQTHVFIDDWTDAADSLTWTHTATRSGLYELCLTYATDAGAGAKGSEVVVTLGDESVKATLENTKGMNRFTTTTVGQIRIAGAGKQTLTLKASKKVGAKVMALKAIGLLPVAEGTKDFIAQAEKDGSIIITAKNAEIRSQVLQWDSRPHRQSIGNWKEQAGMLSWRAAIPRPGVYKVEATYTCAKGQAGSEMNLLFMPENRNVLDGGRVTFVTEESAAGTLFSPRIVGEIELFNAGILEIGLLCKKLVGTSAIELRQFRLIPAGAAGPAGSVPVAAVGEGASLTTALRYKFADGHREAYAVRIETGDDRDRRVREGNVTYQFSAPSAIGFIMEIAPGTSSGRSLVGTSAISAQQSFGSDQRLRSGPIKFDNLGDPSEASSSNRTRPIPGDVQSIIIIPLAEKPGKSWTRELSLNVTFPTRSGQTRTSAATESHTFTIDKIVDKSIAITRTMKVVTKDVVNGKPMWEMSLKGSIVLSADGGLPLEGEWAGDIVQRDDRGEFRTPFRESFRRLGDKVMKEMAEKDAKRKEDSAKFSADIDRLNALKDIPVALRQPITATALTKAMEDLKSKDNTKMESAVETLLKTKPDAAKKFEVLPVLRAVKRGDSTTFVTFGIMHLEEVWGNAVADAPVAGGDKGKPGKLSAEQTQQMLGLIRELSSKDVSARRKAAEHLEQYPDTRAASALAGALTDPFIRREATRALKNMGPMAADQVLQHLNSSDHFLAKSAIEVLAAQGTKKHVEAMKKRLQTERNGIIEDDLKEAILAASDR